MNKKKNLKLFIGTLITVIVIITVFMILKGSNYIFAKYYYWNGFSKQKSKDFTGAIADYDKVLSYDSSFVTAYISKGSANLDLKNYNEAITDYNKALTLSLNDAEIYAYRGRAYYELGDSLNALSDYDKAIAIDNHFAYAYYNRGLLKYTIYKDFESGCADFVKAAELGDLQAKDVIESGQCK